MEKAKFLHVLFPDQIRRFLVYAEETTKIITSTPEKVKDKWGSKTISAEVWIALAKEIQKLLMNDKDELVANNVEFGNRLFTGYRGIFMIQCLQDYIEICPHSKFIKAIELFFDV